jgi:dephospho-CoA kinase
MIVYVVPLLFESATPMPELETIVLVTAPEHERVARIVSRDGLSEQAALGRIQSQLPDSQKIPRSHFVISNDSTLEALKQKSVEVFAMISKEARQNLPVTRKWRLS